MESVKTPGLNSKYSNPTNNVSKIESSNNDAVSVKSTKSKTGLP